MSQRDKSLLFQHTTKHVQFRLCTVSTASVCQKREQFDFLAVLSTKKDILRRASLGTRWESAQPDTVVGPWWGDRMEWRQELGGGGKYWPANVIGWVCLWQKPDEAGRHSQEYTSRHLEPSCIGFRNIVRKKTDKLC